MKKPKALDIKSLKRSLNVSVLNFTTTNQVKKLKGFVGQKRALAALKFGIDIKNKGYNLYAMGPPGIGKYSLVNAILSIYAKKSPTPSDWCYIYNFETPSKPIALQLPAGVGSVLQRDMNKFIVELGLRVQSVFDSQQFRSEMRKIAHYYNKKYKIDTLKSDSDKIPDFSREKYLKEKKLILKLMSAVLSPLIDSLKIKYRKYKEVIKYLSAAQKDILDHPTELIHADEKTSLFLFTSENAVLFKYTVNLFVDNKKVKGAPIVFETAPNYSNLICRIEHASQHGAMITNFTLIRPGCLHRANGGYLILEIRKLLKNLEAWEALKSAIYAEQIRIESVERTSGTVKPISLEPMPIPLKVKIILIGDRNTYYSLCQNDPDFTEIFKVAVDFDEQIERSKKNIQLYAQLISTIVKREKLKPFHASAVAEVIDYSSRLSQDALKLSTHVRDIEDLILEANYWAGIRKAKLVKDIDIKSAVSAQTHRVDRSREIYYEDIIRNFIIINTEGKSIGQVNCLSVRRVGNFAYGHPTRVTARIRKGKGKIIDIQREIKMSGPIHNKGSMIIANFLASRFNQEKAFSLFASISFEQIYCWTEGDSASVGELCALLSALAEVPIRQALAVTGSIDQYGEVQAVGGINEKVEGFFDVCKAKGLNGRQGVLIPAVNEINLILREDIIEAAKNNKFFIYPIRTIDEAMTLLTGQEVGTRMEDGRFPENSIYYKVEKKLAKFGEKIIIKKNSKYKIQ